MTKFFIDDEGGDLIKIDNLNTGKVFRVPRSFNLNFLKDIVPLDNPTENDICVGTELQI